MIVVVLGMHRSGTSLVSSMLHSMGIRMGDPVHLERRDPESQPHGYWEDQDFVSLNRQIIRQAGGHWHQPPPRAKILRAGAGFGEAMGKLIETKEKRWQWLRDTSMGGEEEQSLIGWGWKDPRSCLTMEAWWPYLAGRDVRFVRVRREVGAIIDSLTRRGETLGTVEMAEQATAWRNVIKIHENRVDAFIARAGIFDLVTEVQYEQLVRRDQCSVPASKIAATLGLEGGAYAGALRSAMHRIEFRG
jgi:hypothetical protein